MRNAFSNKKFKNIMQYQNANVHETLHFNGAREKWQIYFSLQMFKKQAKN